MRVVIAMRDFHPAAVESGREEPSRALSHGAAATDGYRTVTNKRGRVVAETQSNAAPFATLLVDVRVVHDNTL
jgi:hypothetical protein